MSQERVVTYRGNFQPDLPAHLNGGVPWSTEAHVAESWEAEGHRVVRVQEDRDSWDATIRACRNAALFLYTSTWGMAHRWDQDDAWAAIKELNETLPTVALHLDRFWGLPRESQVGTEPWFACRVVATADGGNQDRFADAGVDHVWLPPAVAESECEPGTPRPDMIGDVAFCGNWRDYHPEWAHRRDMVLFLNRRFPGRFAVWPKGEQLRGRNLADLYASVNVMVGDSCLVDGRGRYFSDRIPETLGRGGFLLHPHVDGVTDGTLYQAGEHLDCWDLGDWPRLAALVERWLDDPDGRARVAEQGMAHVKAHHTYRVRVRQVLAELETRGLL